MNRFALLFLLLSGCTETSLFVGGKRIMRIQADATNVSYTGNGVTFHADILNHSSATIAGGRAFANSVGSIGVALAGVGTVLLPGTSGIAPMIARSAVIAIPTTVAASRSK